ncbi:MAG: hypothetical protein RMM58_06890 [Chloroflexota bacterium]|nr:hypothetical protein [Dehalococcoidia bacterium]MDW8253588.1 hypothetical protein [Chloroflexota bacterium]
MGEQAWVWVLAAGVALLLPLFLRRTQETPDTTPVEVPVDEERRR